MKGILMLTTPRSGSNWLCDLANTTNRLGNSAEWLAPVEIRKGSERTGEEAVEAAVVKSKTSNDFFAIKIFPEHLHYLNMKYGIDAIQYLIQNHDVRILRLSRNDRLSQAISFAKSIQNGMWTNYHKQKKVEQYNFKLISKCFFQIGNSNAFWESYLSVQNIKNVAFSYEDMLKSPLPYLQFVSAHEGFKIEDVPESKHSIQRNSSSQEWREKFLKDVENENVLEYGAFSSPPKKGVKNLFRYLTKGFLKPFPYIVSRD